MRSRGFAVSLVVIFIYYILLSAGQGFAEQGTVPAWFGLWLPNIVFGSLGVVLLRRAGRERTLFGTWIPTSPRICAARCWRTGVAPSPREAWRQRAASIPASDPRPARRRASSLRTFALTMLAFVAIYLLADFFDRFDNFLAARRVRRARSCGSSSTACRSSSRR